MLSHLRPALVSMGLFTVLLGLAYPLAVTGVAQAAFPNQANGSLIRDADGKAVGSALIGQVFAKPEYFHGRPSAAGAGYDASASSGSNMGPLNETLIARQKTDAAALRAENPGVAIPADAVTTSGSGLDPDISPANARFQAPRVAGARGVPEKDVTALIDAQVQQPLLGFIGQPRVNVLALNRALDARYPPLASQKDG
ncbi:potassium-transporting ATPase subunit KdpC [Caulobacter vibrioides]|uniref:potassium-transporting ATPase subunit KdpC n=1 Tax=Caulobacter vibrioides TaxID=155892 RepID=UPI000BB49590|nr:potassium-transporting ATPase subunit KdpC [Caulobacter vibrioides]ATC24605.1 potassium-transporting ATPase subunit KdpC [Caulobacter vibrioides]AZH12743.1 potassium-transporting ATPase subunit KdpC [Caulobacter vibrioides]PLR10150.1 potassium-transporting ATPase subunit KdpC [Caulobacter vibrioides]